MAVLLTRDDFWGMVRQCPRTAYQPAGLHLNLGNDRVLASLLVFTELQERLQALAELPPERVGPVKALLIAAGVPLTPPEADAGLGI